MTRTASEPNDGPAILLVGQGDELGYLVARYARQGLVGLHVRQAAPDGPLPLDVAAVWFASVAGLDELRPRERGLIGEDTPIIVSCAAADDARAGELGADHCVRHPLTYGRFLTALRAVGLAEAVERDA